MGRLRTPVAATALAWTLVLVIAVTLPSTPQNDTPAGPPAGGLDEAQTVSAGPHPYAAAIAATAAIGVGVCLYWTAIRGRIARGEAGPPASVA